MFHYMLKHSPLLTHSFDTATDTISLKGLKILHSTKLNSCTKNVLDLRENVIQILQQKKTFQLVQP